jgi:hypothetical protein
MIEERKHSLLSLVVVIACSIVAFSLAIGVLFWTVGVMFHMLGWLIRLALIVGVAAFVWRLVVGRSDRRAS